ncbi:OadG family protein [Pseudidiomarina sediminum]|uniref:OadG family protein n=1 Tax=Pseudidiomarina sediminum TaxID=431675 RepID=UPI001C97F749|nr:OadG family protein [Pseudidiomarina sediminum]MBY6064727.1 OadG family protein [Pseudidiomarina sediminum]
MQQQLLDALMIMTTGMLSVVVFLSLLLLVMGLLRRFAAEPPHDSALPQAVATASTTSTDAQRIAAITAAVHAYRRDHPPHQ